MNMKQPYRPADDGPGIHRLRRDERFEALRLETLRLQQKALSAAAKGRAHESNGKSRSKS